MWHLIRVHTVCSGLSVPIFRVSTVTGFNCPCFQQHRCYFSVPVFSIAWVYLHIQSTLVSSNSKGLSETLRDIRTSTYQICGNVKNNKSNSIFNKWICNLTPEIRDILKILWKRGEIAPQEQFLLFSTIFCYLLLDVPMKTGTRFSPR